MSSKSKPKIALPKATAKTSPPKPAAQVPAHILAAKEKIKSAGEKEVQDTAGKAKLVVEWWDKAIMPEERIAVGEIDAILVNVQKAVDRVKKSSDLPSTVAVYIKLRLMHDRFESLFKALGQIKDFLKNEQVPKAFEANSGTTFTSDLGYRITVSDIIRASIKEGCKDPAFKWLRGHDLQDIITETVNASTLSAVAKKMIEEAAEAPEGEGVELPDALFNVVPMKSTSMTKVK